jgi:phage terminase large subunit
MRSSHRQKIQRAGEAIKDPSTFARTMLGHTVWPRQHEILQSVAKFPKTAVKACHASGKTFTAAEATLWWLTIHRKAIVVTTAPTWTQVERLLWGEIHSAIRGANIDYPRPAATHLQLDRDRYAIGLSTDEGVRFQGFHGFVLIIIDEAPGVLPGIFGAIEGIRAGGDVRVLALGNPVISSGPFYDAFSSGRESWNSLTISAFDTPNLEGITLEQLLEMPEEELDRNPCPYLISRRWVKEKYFEWGPNHPLWESRVMGNFPLQSEDALLSLTWLEQAKLREDDGEGEMTAGLDVAGPGKDETALCIRRGRKIIFLQGWPDSDSRGKVVAALNPYKQKLKQVNIDSIGIGHGMVGHLKDLGFPVRAVNVGGSARDKEKHANLKAELYWGFRERASCGDLGGLVDDKAISQLASIRYEYNARGQIVIESKEQARKRGVKSPDRAEAIILGFANVLIPGANVVEFYASQIEQLKKEGYLQSL